MITKKALLAMILPISFSSAFAAVQVIPQAVQDMKMYRSNQSRYVLKDAKGVALEKTLLSVTPENWFNLSPSQGIEGVRTEETYERFGVASSEDIIVAVVDSGVDVNHEDLQGKIWTNEGEIADNGIDDDQNGYVDDVFGWNFIGGSDGMAKIVKDDTLKNGYRLTKGDPSKQTEADTLELTREVVRMQKLKAEAESRNLQLSAADAEYLLTVETVLAESIATASKDLAEFKVLLEKYKASETVLRAAGFSGGLTEDSVREFTSENSDALNARKELLAIFSSRLNEAKLKRIIKSNQDQLAYHLEVTFDQRHIVGDNQADQTEKIYGNNDVIGPDSGHGTHVAGSIAAVRDNAIGMKGVATNVKIMAVRVVPNGDERDKDVANGIRYAVDNGAKIINMSFGKAFSPYKPVVDEAVRYARSKGVLLLHAAGNDSKNNDLIPSYPNRVDQKEKGEFNNWLEVGASSFKKGLSLPAAFTNYGKKTVDVFAPGVDIYSTTPDNNYGVKSGTSMATPTVAGVAALILSFDPTMSAEPLKALLLDTSRRYPNLLVKRPSDGTKVLFSSLSTTGTIVDAFEAVQSLH